MTRRLVLLGGGHAHLFVLEALARNGIRGVQSCLVAPAGSVLYSGMAPGVIAGHYAPEEGSIDVAALAGRARCELHVGRATAIDAKAREVTCEDGRRIPYDLLSIAVGSEPDMRFAEGAREHALAAKPIEALVARWESLARADAPPRHIVVIGGGGAGVEISLAIAHRLARQASGESCSIDLLTDAPSLLTAMSTSAARRLARALSAAGVKVHTRTPVTRVTEEAAQAADGRVFPADLVICATGGAAPAWLRDCGLATDERGFLRVDASLRSTSHPEVFAAGDVASVVGQARAKAGVYAVRAGPVLARNLGASVTGEPLTPWRAPKRFLALFGTGGRHAVGTWGPFSWEGRWVWDWKERIDRRFIARFSEPR